MFSSQSRVVMSYPKANTVKQMTCSLYPVGLLHGTKIIIDKILVFFISCNFNTLVVLNLGSPIKYSENNDTT